MPDVSIQLEQEKMKSKNILLGVLLTITGFITAYSTRQGQIHYTTIIVGFCIFLLFISDLFLITVSMSSTCIFKKYQWLIEPMYFVLSLSFAVMLPLFFVSSVINPVTLVKSSITNSFGSTIVSLVVTLFIISYILFITLVLYGALSSKFANYFCLLSEEDKNLCRVILVIFFIIAESMSVSQNKVLPLIILGANPTLYTVISIVEKRYKDKTMFHNWMESKHVIIVTGSICILTVIILVFVPLNAPSTHHYAMINVSIVLDNVSLAYNNTTVNIQNLTLSVNNVSATDLT